MTNPSGDERWDERREFEQELLTGQAAALLVELRKSLGLSQRELARRLGVTESRVSQILAGGENLTLKSLAELAWSMGIRFELVPVPLDRSQTNAADPLAPDWLHDFATRAVDRVRQEGL